MNDWARACGNCHARVPDDAGFCPTCGAQLVAVHAGSQTATQPPPATAAAGAAGNGTGAAGVPPPLRPPAPPRAPSYPPPAASPTSNQGLIIGLVAASVLVVIVAVGIVVLLSGRDSTDPQIATTPPPAASTPANSTPPASAQPSASSSSTSSTPSTSTPAPAPASTRSAGGRIVSTGSYRIRIPASWVTESSEVDKGSYIESKWHVDGDTGVFALVDHTPGYTGSAQEGAESVRSSTRRSAGYQEFSFGQQFVSGRQMFVWEFELPGTHRIDYFTTGCANGYAVLVGAPPGLFDDRAATLRRIAASFTPTC